MEDEFLENLGLEISIPDVPVETIEEVHETDTVEKTDSAPKEDETKVADVQKEAAPQEEVDSQKEELERLRRENENLNKRLKDTQRSLTQKSEELKNARKQEEVADSIEKDNSEDEEDDDWFSDDEKNDTEEKSLNDDSIEEIKARLRAQEEELRKQREYLEQQSNAQALSAWQKAEQPVIEAHPDYKEIVDGPFLDVINNGGSDSEFWLSEFKKAGGTPEAAYKIAKKYCDYIEYKPKSAPKEEKEIGHKTRLDDPDFNSAPPTRNEKADSTDWDDPLERFYADK